jgi:AMP-binding enzyme C-terminal domain
MTGEPITSTRGMQPRVLPKIPVKAAPLDRAPVLTLQDRSKDMIISGGSNIYPREIEGVLLRHPDLVEASVVGRPHPAWGEEVVAFLVPRDGAAVAAAELDRLCLDHIANFQAPTRLPLCRSAPEEQLRQGPEDRITPSPYRQSRRGAADPMISGLSAYNRGDYIKAFRTADFCGAVSSGEPLF